MNAKKESDEDLAKKRSMDLRRDSVQDLFRGYEMAKPIAEEEDFSKPKLTTSAKTTPMTTNLNVVSSLHINEKANLPPGFHSIEH